MDKLKSVKVNFSITEETKNKLDAFRKKNRINMSDLVDTLLKFDDSSVEKIFEMYTKVNPKLIEKYNRINTKCGIFLWNKSHIEMVNKFPLNKIDDTMINIAAIELDDLSKSSENEELLKMLKNQRKVQELILSVYDEQNNMYSKLEKMQEEIDRLKNNI